MLVPTSQNMYNNYLSSVPQQMGDYRNLMGGYQGMASGQGIGGYSRPGEMNEAFGGYAFYPGPWAGLAFILPINNFVE